MKRYLRKIIIVLTTILLICFILCFNISLDYHSISSKASFCTGCGVCVDTYCAQYLLSEDNIYYINSGEKEAETAYSNKFAKYNIGSKHIDPSTGQLCTNATNTSTSSCKGYKGYNETHDFPVINLSKNKLAYTGDYIEPEFIVTYCGVKIDKSNYDYYYSRTFADYTPRPYSYCSQVSKNIKDKGTYYLYVMFKPGNTCGPNGSQFLGRISATFDITDGSSSGGGDNPSGGGTPSGGTPSGSGGNVKKNTVITENGKTYYIDGSGKKVTNSVVKVGSVYYYFGSSGAREYPNNEYKKGIWFTNGEGSTTYCNGRWKSNSKGWWYEDNGWCPYNQWLKIDGDWYYFTGSGYMDYSEYRDGYWLGSDGAWDTTYSGGHWVSNTTGWWYQDGGWCPSNEWVWINGKNYHFNDKGYCTNP